MAEKPVPVAVPVAPVVSGLPAGLQYLTVVDQLLVHQQIECAELFSGCEFENKYLIRNTLGQVVYFAREESDCCKRQCCGPARDFTLHITDNSGVEVLTLRRPLKCMWTCCYCCLQELTVEAAGILLGIVRQRHTAFPFKPAVLEICDPTGQVQLVVQAPCCPCGCADVNFPYFSSGENKVVGNVCKQWTGCARETFTDADNFSLTFPMDMDARMKATMIGALFLIDYMFFETQQNNN